ncbi:MULTISPECIES: plasmid partitioning protein RepB C-terminal domain-containing protein [Ralstonia]|uniref:Putative transcriptional regulator n=1 Tax=Ralstonia pickettii OR214 TaxID=1264675 RepID=R0CPD2_RALPI|nr:MULTISPECIES: plasmid partitioning protein RepB C-terminal domain-containing protein [Ralstonia]MCM3580833.1 ParB N-terminal domain-containing protein [Ralstonia pickettii]MEA3269615.1 plasmid partitioning protein RepB C-terminal domain-containing protein [Pseudomonadota bacterium]ENZ78295.1 putative transcriptional regulator [Ralstonia pickettii OR214]MBL4778887.1 ParB N-terminal domain-containing protein [Ralstonia sp.]MDR9383589.1 plasmid partitioning protein RepB C-terminal domain-conta
MTKPPLGFVPEPLLLPLSAVLPSRKTPEGLATSRKFKQIIASIEAVGLIEPLSVGKPDRTGQYILLDGHTRLVALKQLGFEQVPCLVATDDESYTYNNRVNRLSSIQEHLMIRRAVERGVTPERLAKALDVDISHIIKKLNLLDGICPEAAELLRDQTFSANLGAVLRKMKPTRQVECVELMVSANNITVAYAQALVAATPSNMLVGEVKPKKMTGVSADQMAKMEREMGNLQEQFKLAEQSYGQDILNLVLAKGYLAKLMANEAILRHLTKKHPDVLNEFDSIVRMVTLDK